MNEDRVKKINLIKFIGKRNSKLCFTIKNRIWMGRFARSIIVAGFFWLAYMHDPVIVEY